MLGNILSNAIKFSHIGGEIKIIVKNVDDSFIEILISDKGIGMPPDLVKSIFSATKPTTRKGTLGEKGTGFGMPLVKLFMDIYDAKIFVNSKMDKENSGTEFRLVFNGSK